MPGILENCIAGTLVLVAFAVTICQGQDCQLNATPHPQGYCGERLAQAHNNLCFLLRQYFPRHFPNDKRSPETTYLPEKHLNKSPSAHHRVTRDSKMLERIYSIPMSLLASVQLTDDNWRSILYKRGGINGVLSGEKSGEYEFTLSDLQGLPERTRVLIKMLRTRRSPMQKRSRGLACECCINSCNVRTMATYC